MKRGIAALACILAIGLCISCNPRDGESATERTVTIDRVGWVISNIDKSYWNTPPNATAFISIDIRFAETDIVAEDIASVCVTAPDGETTWEETDAADIAAKYNSDRRVFYYNNLWNTVYAANGSIVPIGTYAITVTLVSGESGSYDLSVPAPGALSAGTAFYAYTEDYTSLYTQPGSGYVNLPGRASLVSAVYDQSDDSLETVFYIDDPLVFSGNIWLYDYAGVYIGCCRASFREFGSGAVAAAMNGGTAFHNDGTHNVLTLNTAEANLEVSRSLSEVSSFRILLTDGAQYLGTSSTYDTRSISVKGLVSSVP